MTHPLNYTLPTLPGPAEGLKVDQARTESAEREWSRPWMAVFLRGLRAMPNVAAAARLASVNYTYVYQIRSEEPDFAAAWDEALEQSYDLLESYAHRMSTEGLEVTETRRTVTRALDGNGALVVVGEQEQTVTNRMVSPHMAQFLLRAYRPKRFTQPARFEHAGKDGAPIQHEIERKLEPGRALELARVTLELAEQNAEVEGAEEAVFTPVEEPAAGNGIASGGFMVVEEE